MEAKLHSLQTWAHSKRFAVGNQLYLGWVADVIRIEIPVSAENETTDVRPVASQFHRALGLRDVPAEFRVVTYSRLV
jgi:hypothetical protein